jgi:hypothetical protein
LSPGKLRYENRFKNSFDESINPSFSLVSFIWHRFFIGLISKSFAKFEFDHTLSLYVEFFEYPLPSSSHSASLSNTIYQKSEKNMTISRTTSIVIEKSSWYLFYPYPSASISNSNNNSSNSNRHQQDYSLYIWMTIGLGLAGFKLCFDAVEFYQFCAAWNLISRRNKVDTDVVNYSKKSIMERNIQIENSLNTTTFGDYFTVQQQQQMIGNNNINNNNNNNNNKKQQQQQQSMDITSTLLSQTKAATTPQSSPTMTTTTACTICLGNFQANERISCSKHSTCCKHIFHTACLHAWLFKHTSCPVCRYGMVPAPPTLQILPSLLLEPSSSISPISIFSY